MKKFSIVLIVLGVIFAAVGGAIIATSRDSFWASMSVESSRITEKTGQWPTDGIDTILVDTSNNPIEFVPGDSDKIEVDYYESEREWFEIGTDGGVLSIKSQRRGPLLSFDLASLFAGRPTLRVKIPNTITVGVDIATSNSEIRIENLSLKNLQAKSSNGKISLINVKVAEQMVIDTSNGGLNVVNCTAGRFDGSTTNGSVELSNLVADKVSARSSNGRVSFTNLTSPLIDLGTSNGQVEGDIAGAYDDFQKDLGTSNGSIKINGTEYGHKVESHTGAKSIRVSTSNGGIDLKFVTP
jgi:hypothetical protein